MSKTKMPIQEQIISLKDAKKLLELLGDHAPDSVWMWMWDSERGWIPVTRYSFGNDPLVGCDGTKVYNAYTGDELVLLLIGCVESDSIIPLFTNDKAALAIKNLTNDKIKPEEFNYGLQ